ncbi:mitochondrial fission ELM1 family protein [Hyphobacterium sp.]|jgi:hypothetical protein|uniref:mitochondrial fission ELM1 family protein n=1 Tax=Hyphobacterium sp. TaxID=2004662 RepID=UPI003BACF6E1
MDFTPEIWAVADNRRGVENQALGLAEALAVRAGGVCHRALVRDDGYVTLPDAENPSVWIGCGRPAIRIARQHRKAYRKARFVYVQDPRGHYDLFDLIVAPQHDGLRRRHTVEMIGSPNRLNAAKLAEARQAFAERIEALPSPRNAVLIGGPNKKLRMDAAVVAATLDRCRLLLQRGEGVMITTSRRTPAPMMSALRELAADSVCWLYDGEGDNPYFAFLAAADRIFVTEESTNMLTEAAFTGAPVFNLPLTGNPGKFRHLHAALESHGALRPFLGRFDQWSYPPLDETGRIASLMKDRFFPT